jgi:type VI secretion system secreted protein VgrG
MILADANKSAISGTDCSMDVVRTELVDCITVLNSQDQIVAKKFSAIDYDYTKPDTELKASGEKEALGGEVYEYPGGYVDGDGAGKVGKKRIEEIAWPKSLVFGEGSVIDFSAGVSFKLSKHPRSSLNQKYMIYSTTHSFDIVQGSDDENVVTYKNEFVALPDATPFAPFRNSPKPKAYGVQPALVVGADDKEINCDENGRVFVQFVWDKVGKKDGKEAIPLRYTQGWAGEGFGLAFVPRVGMEVLIAFDNGDPDRPVIVGCLYNGKNKMPEVVTGEPRVMMLKTKTSEKDGDKANLMSFDDTKDNEKITINATKNFELSSIAKENVFLLKQDGEKTTNQMQITDGLVEMTIEKGEKKLTINEGNYAILMKKGSLTVELEDGDQVLTIKKGNQVTKLDDGAMTITVKKDIKITSDAGITIKAAKDISITSDAGIAMKATKDIAMEANGNISMKATQNVQVNATKNVEVKATMEAKREGLTISDKAQTDMKIEGLNVSLKATMMLKGDANLAVKFAAAAGIGDLAGLTATLTGTSAASVSGGASASLKGAMIGLG